VHVPRTALHATATCHDQPPPRRRMSARRSKSASIGLLGHEARALSNFRLSAIVSERPFEAHPAPAPVNVYIPGWSRNGSAPHRRPPEAGPDSRLGCNKPRRPAGPVSLPFVRNACYVLSPWFWAGWRLQPRHISSPAIRDNTPAAMGSVRPTTRRWD